MLTKPLHLDVHEQIECARTLASRFYTDPATLQIEKTRIFQRTWQLVGTLSQPCGENAGLLDLQSCRISVKARGERSRTLDLFVDIEVERFGLHESKVQS